MVFKWIEKGLQLLIVIMIVFKGNKVIGFLQDNWSKTILKDQKKWNQRTNFRRLLICFVTSKCDKVIKIKHLLGN